MNKKEDTTSPIKQNTNRVKVSWTLKGELKSVQANNKMPLLNTILSTGSNVPYSCCRGMCGRCVGKLEEGEVRLQRNYVLSETHLQQGLILMCVAIPLSPVIKVNYDEF